MNLKAFHILLISLSSLLCLFFGGWSIRAWVETDGVGHLALAVFSLLLALGLAIYVVWFARTMRTPDEEQRRRRTRIRPPALLAGLMLLPSDPLTACAVCYGEAQGPMIDAARLGVWLLFGLVLALQSAFVAFFLYLRRRAASWAHDAHNVTDPCGEALDR